MILGAKLGYFVTGACLFAVMSILSLIWFFTALGPKGETGFFGDLGTETAWHPAALAPELSETDTRWGNWDTGNYPDGEGWIRPTGNSELADLGKGQLETELENAKPVMEALVTEATSEIPGIRDSVKDEVDGDIKVDPDKFTTVDVRMKEVEVAKKDSVLAVARVVPIEQTLAGDLGGKEEGKVSKYLAKQGDAVTPGMPLMEVEADGQVITLNSDKTGKLIDYGFKVGDKIKPNVPFATLDMTGQPGAPEAAEVAAVRVRGSVRVPAFIYLAVSLILMVLHLIGVSKIEKEARLSQPQLA
jgi:biotin carboxyl carrier protein